MDRRGNLLGGLDLSRLQGLEIGPRNGPLVAKAEGPVRYVDYTDTASLKAAQFDARVAVDDIVDVDIVWGGQPLKEAAGGPVDYIVASHVIEHLPDTVGWLLELRDALRPGGVLGLVAPDKRFTFDVRRADTTLDELVETYVAGPKRPTARQLFDAALRSVVVDRDSLWRGESPAEPDLSPPRVRSVLRFALQQKEDESYRDCHCTVFTPASFLDRAEDLARLKLFPFVVARFVPTAAGWDEFHVRLIAVEAGDTAAILHSIEMARRQLADAPKPYAPPPPDDLERTALLDRLREAREERDRLLASTSWRITAPLRRLAGLLRRS